MNTDISKNKSLGSIINGYAYTTHEQYPHVPADVRRVITAIEKTWSEMIEASLPKSILKKIERRHKRHESKHIECESPVDGAIKIEKTVRYQGLGSLRTWYSMRGYRYDYIPDFTVSFERNVPSDQRDQHVFSIRSYVGGNDWGHRPAEVTQQTEFVQRVKKRFQDMILRRRPEVHSGITFIGDGRGTRPFDTWIHLNLKGSDSAIDVIFSPDCIGTSEFVRARIDRETLPFSQWERYFPFELDQQKLKEDPVYQRQVYYRLQHIIVLGEDPWPKEARRIIATQHA